MGRLLRLFALLTTTILLLAGCDQVLGLLGLLPPDLVALSAEVDSGNNIQFRIENDGDESLASVMVAVMFSDNTTIDLGDTRVETVYLDIGGGLSESETVAFGDLDLSSLTPGTYRVGIFVDPDDAIEENLETNNTALASGSITIESGPGQGDVPSIPAALAVNGATTSSLAISWDAVAGATSYELERGPAATGSSWTPLTLATSTSTSHTDTGLSPDTQYWYRVRARNANGAGLYSSAVGGMTLQIAPAAFSVVNDALDGSTLFGFRPSDSAVLGQGQTVSESVGYQPTLFEVHFSSAVTQSATPAGCTLVVDVYRVSDEARLGSGSASVSAGTTGWVGVDLSAATISVPSGTEVLYAAYILGAGSSELEGGLSTTADSPNRYANGARKTATVVGGGNPSAFSDWGPQIGDLSFKLTGTQL